MTTKKGKVLHGCKEIMAYIGISSKLRFNKYIEEGMPARLVNKRWVAHADNLENYFKKYTFYHEKNPPEDAE